MRTRGLLVALTWMVALPAAAARADLPELAGTMVVEGSSPAFVDVRVPREIEYEATMKASFPAQMEGGGDHVHVELRQLLVEPGPFGPNGISFDRFGPPAHRVPGAGATTPDKALRVPAGTYRMYLHTTSAVRVTLRFPGFAGARVFRPRRAATGTRSRMVDPVADEPVGVHAYGASDDLASMGEMAFVAKFEPSGDPTVDRIEHCFYPGGDEGVTAPYRPGCPGGIAAGSMHPTPEQGWLVRTNYPYYDPGRYGIGINVTHPGGAADALFAQAAWTSYDDGEPVLREGAPVVEELGAAAPPPPPMPTPPATSGAPGASPSPGVALARLRSTRLKVRGRRALLPLACPASGAACDGTIALGRSRATPFSIPAGRTRTVRVLRPRGKSRRTYVTLVAGTQQLRFPVRLRR